MDALEHLCQLGHVERVDQAVLDAALDKLAGAIGEDAHHVSPRGQAIRWRSRRMTGTAAAALAAAAVFAALAWPGQSIPTIRPGGARPTSHSQPGAAPANSAGSSRAESRTVAAVLTAFSASSDDILMVTKIVRGEGTCCKTIIRISPARPARRGIVHTRIQTFSTGGSRLSDLALTYTAPATAPAASGGGCGSVFLRPHLVLPPATGTPARLIQVDYPAHMWVKGNVRVQAATVPSAALLRACLGGGQWRDAGPGMLAGAKVIELVSSGGSERLFVSAATFLPVRLISVTPTPYGPTTITFAFRFLRPTAANQATLAPPPVPAGFSRQRP